MQHFGASQSQIYYSEFCDVVLRFQQIFLILDIYSLGTMDVKFFHSCVFMNSVSYRSLCVVLVKCLLFQFSFSFKHSCWSCLTAKTLENETT